MGASVFGILAIFVVIAGLIVWGLSALLGPVGAMALCFVLVCLLMMLVILIQKPKGGGLSGAFGGGGGGSEAAFGAKTGDVLTVATICLFILFLGLAMALTIASKPAEVIASPADGVTPTEIPGEPESSSAPITTTNVIDPEADTPETDAPETDASETDTPEADTPETDAPADTENGS